MQKLLRTSRAQLQQRGTDTDPVAAPTPGAQSLCAARTGMVRDSKAKGPAQSPETRDGGDKWTTQASCTLHSHIGSTGTKTLLNKRQVDTQEEKSQLPNSWGKTGQTDKAFWHVQICLENHAVQTTSFDCSTDFLPLCPWASWQAPADVCG